MSNETLQEKHPKFYKDPHFWIGAIEVEVNCDTTGTYRQIKKGEIFQLSALTLHEFQSMSALQNLTPKFKPQEGDQFIKDLESAVSAATDIEDAKFTWLTYWLVYKNNHQMVSVSLEDISDTCGNTSFSASRYVDTLRKLGYYL